MHSIYLAFLAIVLHIHFNASIANAIREPTHRCPRMCVCGLYMGLNMANCSGENLISANIGMSPMVEFLELSNNDITTVDNHCFKDLRHLETVLLNRNSITFIELDAFSTLTQLKCVNLTHNRLESFDNRIFEQNLHLNSVDLSGNKFMHLPNVPILRSPSLEILNLHKSQLTHLHVNYFEELPNIRFIDLSENLMIILNLAAFAKNNHLWDIDLRRNRLKCDEQTEMSIIWLNRNHVKVTMENCPKKGNNVSIPLTFERLQMLTSNDTTPISKQTPNTTFMDLNQVWKIRNQNHYNISILNEQCNANVTTVEHACYLFEVCTSNLTILLQESQMKFHDRNEKMNVRYGSARLRKWDEFITVGMAFYGGLFIGTICGTIMLFILKLISDCVMTSSTADERKMRRKRRKRQLNSSEVGDTNGEIVVENNAANTGQIVLHERGENHKETIQTNGQRSRKSFLSIFYERPARHRYYRQLNRSATNLVRRLSQSRLFLNSSRAQRNAFQNRQEATYAHRQTESDTMFNDPNESDNTEQNQRGIISHDTVHRFSSSLHSLSIDCVEHQNANEYRLNEIRTCASESDVVENIGRSETPLPPYMKCNTDLL